MRRGQRAAERLGENQHQPRGNKATVPVRCRSACRHFRQRCKRRVRRATLLPAHSDHASAVRLVPATVDTAALLSDARWSAALHKKYGMGAAEKILEGDGGERRRLRRSPGGTGRLRAVLVQHAPTAQRHARQGAIGQGSATPEASTATSVALAKTSTQPASAPSAGAARRGPARPRRSAVAHLRIHA